MLFAAKEKHMNVSIIRNSAVAALTLAFGVAVHGQAPDSTKAAPARQASGATPRSAPSIEKFMKIRAPNSPTLSPDGTLYVRDWPDGVNQIYQRDAGKSLDAPMTRLTDLADGV